MTSSAGAILFIDEVHTIIGASKADGLDFQACSNRHWRAANTCIASAPPRSTSTRPSRTPLARRFQPVYVGRPNVEDLISILRGLKDSTWAHPGVRIAALVRRRPLSHRYITDSLPDEGDRPGR